MSSYEHLNEESPSGEPIFTEQVTVNMPSDPEIGNGEISHSSAVLPTSPVNQPAVISVKTSRQAQLESVRTAGQIKANQNQYKSMDQSKKHSSVIRRFKDPAGDRYIKHDNKIDACRSQVTRLVDHIIFRCLTLLLILVDLGIVIAALSIEFSNASLSNHQVNVLKILDVVALVFSCYFMVEVSFRIFAQSVRVFFRQPLEIVDACVVLVAFIIVVVDMTVDSEALAAAKTVTGLRAVRFVRFFMLIRAISQRKHFERSSRLLVSENKRRFQKDGFDLDLCFVTEHMIAMSFPSQGIMSVYRNPIEEVSRFFNTKYQNHYRIYNCCSERGYNIDKYFSNNVKRIMIDDHNVPSLQEMVDFAEDVQLWRSENRENIIAIHCKGGKGRTGTMVCVWLLHSGAFDSAEDALDYFASRRTDLSVGNKYQGVETPSQSRYVKYFEQMKKNFGGQVPPSVNLRITKISVCSLKGVGNGDGRDLLVKLIVRGEEIFEARFGSNTNCTTIFERETQTITASLNNAPILSGDVKVRFEASSNIPCDYDDCPWYFWFNTAFIENNEISLNREELDNPHKEKTWKLYREEFRVILGFEKP